MRLSLLVKDAVDVVSEPSSPTIPTLRPLPNYNSLLTTHLNNAQEALSREYVGEEIMEGVITRLRDSIEGVKQQSLMRLASAPLPNFAQHTDPSYGRTPPPSPVKRHRLKRYE